MQAAILKNIAGIEHNFGTYSEPKSLFVKQHWDNRAKKTQVHGTKIIVASEASANSFVDADGIYTTHKNLLILVVNADCYPVLLSRKDGNAIAALHVGWRGTLNGIIYQFGDLLKAHNENPADWVAAVGPGARSCCYQVSQELVQEFCTRYPISEADICKVPRMINLSVIISHQLQSIGISGFEEIDMCTICSSDKTIDAPFSPLFHSYRRDAKKDVQVSAIMMASNG